MKTIKLLVILLIVILVTCSCGRDNIQSELEEEYKRGYDAGYEEGYDAGHYEGESQGWNDAHEELADMGILRKVTVVYLSKEEDMFYHSFFCELADHERERFKEDICGEGYVPCDKCNGGSKEAYTAP